MLLESFLQARAKRSDVVRDFFFFFWVQKAAGNACPRTMQDELGAMGAGWSGTFYCTHGGDRQKHIKDLRECQST